MLEKAAHAIAMQLKRGVFVFNPSSGDGTTPPTLVLISGATDAAKRLPPGIALCAPDFEAFLNLFPVYVTDRSTNENGAPLSVTRPCAPTADGARRLRFDDIRMLTAVLGSPHECFAAEQKILKELGLEVGTGTELGRLILERCRKSLRKLIRFMPIAHEVVNRFALLLSEVGHEYLGFDYIPPGPLPTGLRELLLPWLLNEDPQTPFPADELDYAEEPWSPLADNPVRRRKLGELAELFRAALQGDTRQFVGLKLNDNRSIAKIAERLLAENPKKGKTFPQLFREMAAAFRQLLTSLRSHAERCEVLLWFVNLLYRPDLLSDLPKTKDFEGTRAARVAVAIRAGAAAGFAPPVVRGSKKAREDYRSLIAGLPAPLFAALLAGDDDAFETEVRKLPEEIRPVAHELRNGAATQQFVRELSKMYRDPARRPLVLGLLDALKVLLRDMIVPNLFSPPGLTAEQNEDDVRSALVTAAVFGVALNLGPGSNINRLLDRHPVEIDPVSGNIRNPQGHAAGLLSDVLANVVFNEDMQDTVLNRLPKLAQGVADNPAGVGAATMLPTRAGSTPAIEEQTAADQTATHPRWPLKILREKTAEELIQKMLPAADGTAATVPDDESPVASRVRALAVQLAPSERDTEGRWLKTLSREVYGTLSKDIALIRDLIDRRVGFESALAEIAKTYCDHADAVPALRTTTERLFLGLFIRGDQDIALGTPDASHLRLIRDLLQFDPANKDEIRANLPLNRYVTDEMIDKLAQLRRTLEKGSATRYPMARLISDLYALRLMFKWIQETRSEALLVLGDAGQFLDWLEADNLGKAAEGGLFRNGKLLSGQSLPALFAVLGETAFGRLTKREVIARYRTLRLAADGQSYVPPPLVLSLGYADPDGDWVKQGRELSDEALAGEEVPVHIIGPSPVLAKDDQVTIPAAFLVGARLLGANCAGVTSPAAADVSTGRFHSLSSTSMNDALDRAIYGPLLPEKDGLNPVRSIAADCYVHHAITMNAALEKSGGSPIPTWTSIHTSFVMTANTTHKTAYRAAAAAQVAAEKLTGRTLLNGNARRFALTRDAAGAWQVRIGIDPRYALDEDDGKQDKVAVYAAPHLSTIRQRAGLSPDPVTPAPLKN